MRIAYAVAGHLRRFRDNWTIVKNLLDKNPGDLFVHTFPVLNVPDRSPCWHSDRHGNDTRLNHRDIADLFTMYPSIKALEIDSQECGADHLRPELQGMGFRWSWCRANELVRTYQLANGFQYDCVFNLRLDLWLHEPMELQYPKAATVYGSGNKNQEEQGNDGDVWLYGAPGVMQLMHVSPTAPFSDAVPSWGLVGERLVTAIRKRNNFSYEPHRVRCALLRSNGLTEIV